MLVVPSNNMESTLGSAYIITVDPPNTAALGTGEKRRYWKTAVKGVIILYNQEKTYSGLENQWGYWGRPSTD